MANPSLSPESLLAGCPALEAALEDGCQLSVALSGGCDSLLLLHLLTRLVSEIKDPGRLRAIHINHRLQPEADVWARFCRRFCREQGVPLRVVRLDGEQLRISRDGSLENSARKARYKAFESLLRRDEVLLQGHHADDQMETILFRLVRGSGPLGLAGIPRERTLGRGRLLRPFLNWSREDIEKSARQAGLEWIEDPSNEETDFDRNFLRHEILPGLRQRWPGARQGFLRSQQLLVDADECNAALALHDLEGIQTAPGHLAVTGLLDLSPARRRNVLQHFLFDHCHDRKVAPPDHVSLGRIADEVLVAGVSANPVVRWPKGNPGTEVRRYDGLLHVLPALQPVPGTLSWSGKGVLELGAGLGSLRLKTCRAGGFPWSGQPLAVKFNVPGLRITRPDRPSRSLGRLCQELRIPPWERERLPLLFCGEELLSVADMLVPVQDSHKAGPRQYQIEWIREDLH